MSDNTPIQLIIAQRARERAEGRRLAQDQNMTERLLDVAADFAAAVITPFVIVVGAGLYLATCLYRLVRR
jgi:hypothetical protein